MMKFDIITIFPEAFTSYLNTSILKRAQEKRLIDIHIHNLRNFAGDERRTVDGRPYGGGPGMVLKIEPIARAIGSILRNSKPEILNSKQIQNTKLKKRTKIILFSAAGKQFDQKMARDLSKNYDRIVMIAGHYEGIDERIKKIISDFGFRISDLSVGPYVLTGGELPVMVVVDATSRHVAGVLGKEQSLEENRLGIGVPAYTRPENFIWRRKNYRVPKVLLSGDHAKIAVWRRKHKRQSD
ncbi:MAG: tRNA (guanosine(37)-N1)-methyltransferase TrmD [Candidatus Sungbacteria bacterium]|nr:tRNA (guanosine(37)-N1)-methyltransferase TrmD [Candidatus Sungbacteria bacterium]